MGGGRLWSLWDDQEHRERNIDIMFKGDQMKIQIDEETISVTRLVELLKLFPENAHVYITSIEHDYEGGGYGMIYIEAHNPTKDV